MRRPSTPTPALGALAVACILLAVSVATLAKWKKQPRIELTEGQAATIHDCFDNGLLARVTFNEHEQAVVTCVAAFREQEAAP